MPASIPFSQRTYRVRCQHCGQIASGPALPSTAICVGCGTEFQLPTGRRMALKPYCSRDCWRKHGVIVASDAARIEARFWAMVNKTKRCWIWTGSKHPRGYGQLVIGTRTNRRVVLAHRFAWELKHGPIPAGKNACHRCDNPQCVRPSHLFLGSQSDNMRDMYRKGRRVQQRGPRIRSRSA